MHRPGGYYTEADFQHLTEWMVAVFRERGSLSPASITSRITRRQESAPTASQESFDRKPQPGMVLKARDDLNLDLARSVFMDSDMVAGIAAGAGQLIKLTPVVTSFASGFWSG